MHLAEATDSHLYQVCLPTLQVLWSVFSKGWTFLICKGAAVGLVLLDRCTESRSDAHEGSGRPKGGDQRRFHRGSSPWAEKGEEVERLPVCANGKAGRNESCRCMRSHRVWKRGPGCGYCQGPPPRPARARLCRWQATEAPVGKERPTAWGRGGNDLVGTERPVAWGRGGFWGRQQNQKQSSKRGPKRSWKIPEDFTDQFVH